MFSIYNKINIISFKSIKHEVRENLPCSLVCPICPLYKTSIFTLKNLISPSISEELLKTQYKVCVLGVWVACCTLADCCS